MNKSNKSTKKADIRITSMLHDSVIVETTEKELERLQNEGGSIVDAIQRVVAEELREACSKFVGQTLPPMLLTSEIDYARLERKMVMYAMEGMPPQEQLKQIQDLHNRGLVSDKFFKELIYGTAEPKIEEVKAEMARPDCPRCGVKMIKRTCSVPYKAGEQFYGCASYPTCKGTRTLNEAAGTTPSFKGCYTSVEEGTIYLQAVTGEGIHEFEKAFRPQSMSARTVYDSFIEPAARAFGMDPIAMCADLVECLGISDERWQEVIRNPREELGLNMGELNAAIMDSEVMKEAHANRTDWLAQRQKAKMMRFGEAYGASPSVITERTGSRARPAKADIHYQCSEHPISKQIVVEIHCGSEIGTTVLEPDDIKELKAKDKLLELTRGAARRFGVSQTSLLRGMADAFDVEIQGQWEQARILGDVAACAYNELRGKFSNGSKIKNFAAKSEPCSEQKAAMETVCSDEVNPHDPGAGKYSPQTQAFIAKQRKAKRGKAVKKAVELRKAERKERELKEKTSLYKAKPCRRCNRDTGCMCPRDAEPKKRKCSHDRKVRVPKLLWSELKLCGTYAPYFACEECHRIEGVDEDGKVVHLDQKASTL